VLIAPCWIGDQVSVEAGAVVGPDAIIEDRSVVDAMARVTQSWIGPDTCVGPMTSVSCSLAWGSTLVDWRTDSTLHVPDPFLLSSLVKDGSRAATDRFGRALPSAASVGPKTGSPAGASAPIGRAANANSTG
jgi:NDP-sugar pyrophosphorylase family protein